MDKKLIYDEIIPLGYDCTIARQLDNLKFRTKSYPFDWVVSINTNNIVNCIIDNFDHFFKKRKNEKNIYVNYYDIIFLHHSHFTEDVFREEFNKKIFRFNEMIRSDKKILLIRKLHGKHERVYCDSEDNSELDIISMVRLRNYIDEINPNNNIDITTLISCEMCYEKYNNLLSTNNKNKVQVLYEPNGDDNNIYYEYLKNINYGK